MIVVVDREDNFIRNAPRKEVHSSREWHRGSHVFLFNSRGELLLQRRNMTRDKFPGAWDCSASGHLGPGESYEEGARREMMEEILVDAPLERFVHFRMEYGPEDYMVSVLFTGECEELPGFDPSEIDEVAFFSKEEVTGMIARGECAPWLAEMFKYYVGLESRIERID